MITLVFVDLALFIIVVFLLVKVEIEVMIVETVVGIIVVDDNDGELGRRKISDGTLFSLLLLVVAEVLIILILLQLPPPTLRIATRITNIIFLIKVIVININDDCDGDLDNNNKTLNNFRVNFVV